MGVSTLLTYAYCVCVYMCLLLAAVGIILSSKAGSAGAA